MREMAAPRPRVNASKRGVDDESDAERGRAIDDVGESKHALKASAFPWRRCIIATLCFVTLAGGASRLWGSDAGGDDFAESLGSERQGAARRKVPRGQDSAAGSPNESTQASDALGVGDSIKPLVEVAAFGERNLESAEVFRLPVNEPVKVLQVGAPGAAPGKPGQRWVRIKTAGGQIGWINFLSDAGARIFSTEKKAERPKKHKVHKPVQRRPQQQRSPFASKPKPGKQARSVKQQAQQRGKPRQPPLGSAAGKGAKHKPMPKTRKSGPVKRAKRAVPGGFNFPKPKIPGAGWPGTKPRGTKPQRRNAFGGKPKVNKAKSQPATAGKRPKRAKR